MIDDSEREVIEKDGKIFVRSNEDEVRIAMHLIKDALGSGKFYEVDALSALTQMSIFLAMSMKISKAQFLWRLSNTWEKYEISKEII